MTQAEGAIKKYGVHVVVANLLATRKDRVWLIRQGAASSGSATTVESSREGDSKPGDCDQSRSEAADRSPPSTACDDAGEQQSRCQNGAAPQPSKFVIQVIDRPAGEDCIEIQLVSRVARLHSSYLESVNQSLLRHLMASLSASWR